MQKLITLLCCISALYTHAQITGLLNSYILYENSPNTIGIEFNGGAYYKLDPLVYIEIEGGGILEAKPNVEKGDYFGVRTGVIFFPMKNIGLSFLSGIITMQQSNNYTRAYSPNYWCIQYNIRAQWKFVSLTYILLPEHTYMLGAGINILF